MNQIIKIKNLNRTFTEKKGGMIKLITGKRKIVTKVAVKNISFGINKGEAVAFLGPNGAGKTTTTKMMTGLVYPTSGSISVLGFNPFERKNQFLSQIGLVMGNKAGLNWDLTANQSFDLLAKIYNISDEEYKDTVKNLTTKLKVTHVLDTQVRKLSLGERMKLELIGALLHQPKILFLDEPTIGLDIESKVAVRTFLKNLHAEGETTFILTSHDMDDIEDVCERVIVINDGSIIYDDELNNLTKAYSDNKYIKVVFASQPSEEQAKKIAPVVEYTDSHILFQVKKQDLSKLLNQLTLKFSIEDISIEGVPLESIMSELLKTNQV